MLLLYLEFVSIHTFHCPLFALLPPSPPLSHLYLILHHSMIRKSRKTYYIDGANKSKKKSTPGPDPMLLPLVTILRLAALHIESGVVWCRNGMSDIRKKKEIMK